ncbi:uncharacterized protein LOC123621178 [Lemur catta]|uniref:uncharacterized protein LOC123621178 n=1 Tax=Lemur catta TaxID=9447 RepID=UPI001E266805|nr:uncharacterized protein LOC123621178 [Lemur catta]
MVEGTRETSYSTVGAKTKGTLFPLYPQLNKEAHKGVGRATLGEREQSQTIQTWHTLLQTCPEPPGSSQVSVGLQRKERAGVPSGGSATARGQGTRAADVPRCLKAAREDTAQADAQTGLPHPGLSGGGVGSPGNPGFPSEPARHPGPSCSSYQAQGMGTQCLREPGAPQNSRREVTSQWGTQPVGVARGHGVCPNLAPWYQSASGVRSPRRGAVRGAAA